MNPAWHGFSDLVVDGTFRNGLRYFCVTLPLVFIFYFFLRVKAKQRKIQDRPISKHQWRRESVRSAMTILVFGVVSAIIVVMTRLGETSIYFKVSEFGVAWFACSLVLMVVLHDCYFYWTHRLMHTRWLFRVTHYAHHKSIAPTPMTTYSFNFLEAVVQALYPLVFVLLVPAHPAMIFLFLVHQVVRTSIIHLGYEIFPLWWPHTPWAKIIPAVTHHDIHHRKGRYNYGLYFRFWDRLMGTESSDYEDELNRVLQGRHINGRMPPSGEIGGNSESYR